MGERNIQTDKISSGNTLLEVLTVGVAWQTSQRRTFKKKKQKENDNKESNPPTLSERPKYGSNFLFFRANGEHSFRISH